MTTSFIGYEMPRHLSSLVLALTWNQCYDFKKNLPKNSRFLLQTKLNYAKKIISTLVLRKTPIFCQKLSKITENGNNNIDFSLMKMRNI
jgi:uncharacterized protein Usg